MIILAKVETSELNLYSKLSRIRKMVEALQTNKSGYGYRYVSEDEILSKVTAGLEKYHIDVYPRIVPDTTVITPYFGTKTKYTKNGDRLEENINEVIVKADMDFLWVNLDNPKETMTVPWTVVGQQSDASQALGSGLTYCIRYFLLKFFKSSTMDDDPDNWRQKQQKAKDRDDAEVIEAIVVKIDEIVQKNANESNREALQKFFKGYITKDGRASADYRSIKSAEVATKVLDGLTAMFADKVESEDTPEVKKVPKKSNTKSEPKGEK